MLRIAVIGLFVTNLMLLGWEAQKPEALEELPEPVVETPVARTDLPAIQLVRELPEPAIPVTPQDEEPRQCYTLGPLNTITELRRAKDRLSAVTITMGDRETSAMVDRGYWVYLTGFNNRQAALDATRRLVSEGINDYFVVTSGEWENSVSVGLFSGRENARTRQEQMQALGFEAEVGVRREAQPRFWLDYELIPGANSPWRYLVQASPGAKRLDIPCKAPDMELENPQEALNMAEAPENSENQQ